LYASNLREDNSRTFHTGNAQDSIATSVLVDLQQALLVVVDEQAERDDRCEDEEDDHQHDDQRQQILVRRVLA